MAEKKKILYIVEAMGGGVFTYIVDLANELAKCDADIGISWFENVFEGKALQSKPEKTLPSQS